MLRKREDESLNARQFGTTSASAVAMLDPDSERRMYAAYRAFFRDAETRQWNLWTDIPWDEPTPSAPSSDLITEIESLYRDLLFLPDYACGMLTLLRSSRGRAWFTTRWSYEEGKHLLVLHEWLVRRAGRDDAHLKEWTEALLEAHRWTPPGDHVADLMADALAWEIGEGDRMGRIRDLATAEGDIALVRACDHVAADDAAHRGFLEESLRIIARVDPETVHAALSDPEVIDVPEAVANRLAAVIR